MEYDELIALLDTHKYELAQQTASLFANSDPIRLQRLTPLLVSVIDALNNYFRSNDFDTFKQFAFNFFAGRQNQGVPVQNVQNVINAYSEAMYNLINQEWQDEAHEKLKAAAIRRIDNLQRLLTVTAITTDIKKGG